MNSMAPSRLQIHSVGSTTNVLGFGANELPQVKRIQLTQDRGLWVAVIEAYTEFDIQARVARCLAHCDLCHGVWDMALPGFVRIVSGNCQRTTVVSDSSGQILRLRRINDLKIDYSTNLWTVELEIVDKVNNCAAHRTVNR